MTYSFLNWLYLDFNSYFATIEQQIKPKIRNKPIAIVSTITDTTCAIAASYEAKAYGIKTGTMIYEAKRLCPQLICIQANHQNYIKYHHKLLHEINRYIPVEIVASIDEVACKLTKGQRTKKNAICIAKSIKKGIARNVGDYIKCSIGFSSNRFLAKTASNLEKPDGLQILYPKEVPKKIKHLRLSELTGIGKRIEGRLFRSGIKSVDHLYELSPKHMRKIWGNVQGERFWYLIRGKEIAELKTKKQTIGHSHVLHPHWRFPKKSKQILYRLLIKAASRLRRTNYYTSKLSIILKIDNNKKIEGKAKFYQTCDNFTLLEKTEKIWTTLFSLHHPRIVKKISITLYGLKKYSEIQPNLFDNHNDKVISNIKRRESLSKTMDIINSRFGKDSIVIGSLPNQIIPFSGTKIAFTRIPDKKEFYE